MSVGINPKHLKYFSYPPPGIGYKQQSSLGFGENNSTITIEYSYERQILYFHIFMKKFKKRVNMSLLLTIQKSVGTLIAVTS